MWRAHYGKHCFAKHTVTFFDPTFKFPCLQNRIHTSHFYTLIFLSRTGWPISLLIDCRRGPGGDQCRFFFAEISLKSPRKLFISIIKKYFQDKSIQTNTWFYFEKNFTGGYAPQQRRRRRAQASAGAAERHGVSVSCFCTIVYAMTLILSYT